jgi:hypothetical protein
MERMIQFLRRILGVLCACGGRGGSKGTSDIVVQ